MLFLYMILGEILMANKKKTCVLCVLDGFGYREEATDNAISKETAPFYYELLENNPNGLLKTSGEDVGLPEGQMGNSEVGHLNMGAGRKVYQNFSRIGKAISNGDLVKNKELKDFISKLKDSSGTCHLMGLVSAGGVHSHEDHILALAKTVSDAGVPVMLHLILDGRDTPPRSALSRLPKFIEHIIEAGAEIQNINEDGEEDKTYNIKLGSICGRYYAMDRDKRWERTKAAYELYIEGKGDARLDAESAIEESYDNDIGDEFLEPVVFTQFKPMQDGDGILMANFRADRARQILTAFLDKDFNGFDIAKRVNFAASLGMVEYSEHLNSFMPAIFKQEYLENTLGAVIANKNMTQLRAAETEKYAHVTYFFNGGSEKAFKGETRLMIDSPKVATYDLKPEMSALELTYNVVDAVKSREYDFILVNYANGDMVGHTGNFPAAQEAVRTLDKALIAIEKAVREEDALLLVTADHGNCEVMYDEENNSPHTAHSLNRVPVILVNAEESIKDLSNGSLADIAPTILELMEIEKPKEMTGESLLVV